MGELYRDRWITCTQEAIRIRAYYFPWGTKTVPYTSIRSVSRRPLGVLTGRARIWGSGNPTVWLSLDPGRPGRTEGLLLDLGRRVRPLITPEDPAAVETLVRARLTPGNPSGDAV
jgi:hypothetical protein